MSSSENIKSSLSSSLRACPDCDRLHRARRLEPGAIALCVRCGARLYGSTSNARERALALLVATLILLIVANALPFMSFSIAGRVEQNYLATGVATLFGQGFYLLAGLVLLATVAVPLLSICGMLTVVVRGGSYKLRRLLDAIRPWGMLDVFLLGVIVAIIKLSQLAEIGLGRGFYAFACLVVLNALTLEPRTTEATGE